MKVLQNGNMEGGMWWAGQSQGLIDAVLPCKTLISDIVSDAEAAICRNRSASRARVIAAELAWWAGSFVGEQISVYAGPGP